MSRGFRVARLVAKTQYLRYVEDNSGGEFYKRYLNRIAVVNPAFEEHLPEVDSCMRKTSIVLESDCYDLKVVRPLACKVYRLHKLDADNYRGEKTARFVDDVERLAAVLPELMVLKLVLTVSRYKEIRDWVSGDTGVAHGAEFMEFGYRFVKRLFSEVLGEEVEPAVLVNLHLTHSGVSRRFDGTVVTPLMEFFPHNDILVLNVCRTKTGAWVYLDTRALTLDRVKWFGVKGVRVGRINEMLYEMLTEFVGRPVGKVNCELRFADPHVSGGTYHKGQRVKGMSDITHWGSYGFRPFVVDVAKYLEAKGADANDEEVNFGAKLLAAGNWLAGRGKGFRFSRWYGWMSSRMKKKRALELGVRLLGADEKREELEPLKHWCNKCQRLVTLHYTGVMVNMAKLDDSTLYFIGVEKQLELAVPDVGG